MKFQEKGDQPKPSPPPPPNGEKKVMKELLNSERLIQGSSARPSKFDKDKLLVDQMDDNSTSTTVSQAYLPKAVSEASLKSLGETPIIEDSKAELPDFLTAVSMSGADAGLPLKIFSDVWFQNYEKFYTKL
jgi:hypothetical protein